MNPAERYVHSLYERFPGRVPLAAGVAVKMNKVYPFVFANDQGNPIGIVAMATHDNIDPQSVQVYLVAAFETKKGDGSIMMKALCEEADKMNITLLLQAEPQWAREEDLVPPQKLAAWYRSFGFEGGLIMVRHPKNDAQPSAAADEPQRVPIDQW